MEGMESFDDLDEDSQCRYASNYFDGNLTYLCYFDLWPYTLITTLCLEINPFLYQLIYKIEIIARKG